MSKSIKLQNETYYRLKHYQIDLGYELQLIVTASDAIDQLLDLDKLARPRLRVPTTTTGNKEDSHGT